MHNLISITELFKSHSIEANFNLTTHATLIVCDDIIADMLSNKKFNELVTELFISGRKLNISPVFITQPHFALPKHRDNSKHYFIIKIANNKNYNKLHLIIHQILTLKILCIFTKNELQKHILFYLLTILCIR